MADEGLKIRVDADLSEVDKGFDTIISKAKELGKFVGASIGTSGIDNLSQSLETASENAKDIVADISKIGGVKPISIVADADGVTHAIHKVDNLNESVEHVGVTAKAVARAAQVGFDDLGAKAANAARKLNTVSSPANRATSALTDLGRVAQDAPFGFIAISNNLNPLLESFQRLKTETGSTGGAMKALLGSLTGAGGLGVALSLLSSGMLFAQMGMSAWTRGFGKTKSEAKSLADTIKELIKPIGDIGLAAQGSAQGEIARVGALVRVIQDQNAARSTQVRALEELKRINKSYFGDLTLEENSLKRLTQLQNEYTQAIVSNAILENLKGEIGKVGAELYKQNKAISDNEKKQIDLRRQIEATNKSQIEADAKAGVRTFFLDDQARALTDISVALSKQRKEISPLQEQFNALRNSIQEITLTTLNFKGLNTAKETLKKEAKTFKLEFPEIEIPVSFGGKQIFSESVKEMYDAFQNFKNYFEQKDDLKIEVPLTIDKSKPIIPPEHIQQAITQMQAMQSELDAMALFVGGPLSDTFAGLFRTIATDGKLSMKQVGEAAKQLVTDLIAAAVKAAVLAVIFKAFGGKAGAVGSFGSLFKGLLTGGSKMATGGIVPPGFENDTFPARLSSREAVIPLDRLNSILGNRDSSPGVLQARVSGSDLLFVYERARRSQRRTF